MMAGLAVAAVRTEGQSHILAETPGAGFTYEAGNTTELAAQVNLLIRNPERLRACRFRAFEAAQSRFNWEVEQCKFIELVGSLEKRLVLGASC